MVGDKGGQQQWVTTFKHKRGRVTRRATKSVEHIKHEREGQATRTMKVGNNGGQQWWETTVGNNGGQQWWATKVGDDGG